MLPLTLCALVCICELSLHRAWSSYLFSGAHRYAIACHVRPLKITLAALGPGPLSESPAAPEIEQDRIEARGGEAKAPEKVEK